MHDGSLIFLYKSERIQDITNCNMVINLLEDLRVENRILTGLLYFAEDVDDTHEYVPPPYKGLTA